MQKLQNTVPTATPLTLEGVLRVLPAAMAISGVIFGYALLYSKVDHIDDSYKSLATDFKTVAGAVNQHEVRLSVHDIELKELKLKENNKTSLAPSSKLSMKPPLELNPTPQGFQAQEHVVNVSASHNEIDQPTPVPTPSSDPKPSPIKKIVEEVLTPIQNLLK